MGYTPIFLIKEDYPFLSENECSCEVCKKLNRNVIEPVVLFIDENRNFCNLSKERIRELIEEHRNLHPDRLATCIFHCDKENEIWIENIEEYLPYKKRRDEAIKNGTVFEENFSIEWNETLVNAFWERIRAYRFAVEYFGYDDIYYPHDENAIDLIKFYMKKLKDKLKTTSSIVNSLSVDDLFPDIPEKR